MIVFAFSLHEYYLGLFGTAKVPVDNNVNNLWLRIMQCLAQGNI